MLEQREGESNTDHIKRLFAEADKLTASVEKTFKEMKEAGVIGFCKECGCNIYVHIEHKC